MKAVLQPDEHFFGFGERMDFMDQRGRKIYLNVELGRGIKPAVGGKDILRANYCPVPFMMSTKGYGLFFHTPFATEWNMGWIVVIIIRLKLLAVIWTIILCMVPIFIP